MLGNLKPCALPQMGDSERRSRARKPDDLDLPAFLAAHSRDI